jgi:hypothetical protein
MSCWHPIHVTKFPSFSGNLVCAFSPLEISRRLYFFHRAGGFSGLYILRAPLSVKLFGMLIEHLFWVYWFPPFSYLLIFRLLLQCLMNCAVSLVFVTIYFLRIVLLFFCWHCYFQSLFSFQQILISRFPVNYFFAIFFSKSLSVSYFCFFC